MVRMQLMSYVSRRARVQIQAQECAVFTAGRLEKQQQAGGFSNRTGRLKSLMAKQNKRHQQSPLQAVTQSMSDTALARKTARHT